MNQAQDSQSTSQLPEQGVPGRFEEIRPKMHQTLAGDSAEYSYVDAENIRSEIAPPYNHQIYKA